MRQVLVVHYSQTGQLGRLVQSVCTPLLARDDVQVDFLSVQPAKPYPFPWPFLTFFSIFPETVLMRPEPLQPLQVDPGKRYDLVILAYQVWFLSPSRPITSLDRKSTRLNSSHVKISYAVFCLKKKSQEIFRSS